MRLIADDQIPLGDLELFLQGFIPRELIQTADTKVCLSEYISAGGGFDAVIGQNLKAEMELGIQLVLPLFRQTAGRYDQTALQVAARDQLTDEEPGHDGLAGTGVIRQNKTEREPGQHLLIYSGDLVRERLHGGGMYGQIGVKQMGQADAVSFGSQAHLCAVCIEAPGQAVVLDLKAGLILPIEKLSSQSALVVFVCNLDYCCAVPLHRHDGNRLTGNHAQHAAADCYFLKLCHVSDSSQVGCFSIPVKSISSVVSEKTD